ncbi:hypothetical protein TrCOL_g5940 [Triparma columacea]|nr:hypothetical protein TrCOL_g5940 [Triparma columacea]
MLKSSEIRQKYETDIKALKDEIASLKSSPAAASPAPQSSSSLSAPGTLQSASFPSTNKDLQKKLADYQSFLSDYIVNTQAEKRRAVAEAESKIHAFYQAKMQELALPGSAPSLQLGGVDSAPETLFDKRNRMVAEQGGKGRWIGREVDRAKQASQGAGSRTKVEGGGESGKKVMNIDVSEADHGQRADGGVGGPSLAERVNFGAELMK